MDFFLDLFEKGAEEPFETVNLKSVIDAIVNFVKSILANEFNVEF